MTGSNLTALTANPAPGPETGLISIRFKHPLFGCRSIRILDAAFVPLRFTIIFYSKILSIRFKHPLFGCRMPIEPTHDPPPVPNRRTMGKAWASHPPAWIRGDPPIYERLIFNELIMLIELINCTRLQPIYPHKLVLQINTPTYTVVKKQKPPYKRVTTSKKSVVSMSRYQIPRIIRSFYRKTVAQSDTWYLIPNTSLFWANTRYNVEVTLQYTMCQW